jgi:hypothetical protein
MGRMKDLALDLSDMSYGALRAMLDMGGGLTPYVQEELDRRHAFGESIPDTPHEGESNERCGNDRNA